MKSSPTTAPSSPTTSIPAAWADRGETIIRKTSRLLTGGATEKRVRAEGDLGFARYRSLNRSGIRCLSTLRPYRPHMNPGYTLLSAHSIQNHPRQVHAVGDHGGETRRRAAYIRVSREANGRYDRGGNDQCRLHSRLLLHLFPPGLPLARNRSLHFAHQCTAVRTGLGPSLNERFP